MGLYKYIKDILYTQIAILICMAIDLIHPKILNMLIMPNMFEYMSFIMLLGMTTGIAVSLKRLRKN